MRASIHLVLGPLVLCVACGDDSAASSGGGGGGGSSTSGATTTSASTTTTVASTSGTTTTAGTGGGTGTGGATGTGGTGTGGATGTGGGTGTGGTGAGGGEAACGVIPVGKEQSEVCDSIGLFALPLTDTTLCTADSGETWPAKVVRVAVEAGNCLSMRADNVGSPAGADLFSALVDPSGDSLLFDDELDCTVTNPDGYACPEGAITITTTGDAFVIVGAWEGAGCPAPGETPYELSVAIDGVDVDLTGADVCAGDLLEIIP